jgi:GntR family transcriptional regulator
VTHAPSEIAEALQIKPKSEVIALNRLRYLDGVPEVLVATYIPRQMCPDLLKEDFSRQSLYQVLASKYHLIIAKGYRTIEAISAERGDAKLLQVKTGSPLLLLKSIGLLPSGIPLEFFVAKHRGDRAKFEVRLVRK